MNTGRKRRADKKAQRDAEFIRKSVSELTSETRRLRAANKRLRARLRHERARWDERCPKGHLVRYDECDIVGCYLTNIEPLPTPFTESLPEVPASETYHSWVTDRLRRVRFWDNWVAAWKNYLGKKRGR